MRNRVNPHEILKFMKMKATQEKTSKDSYEKQEEIKDIKLFRF